MSAVWIDRKGRTERRQGSLAHLPAPQIELGDYVGGNQLTPARSFALLLLRPWIWTTGGACSFSTCWR